ncbi:helix-turn-helix transcriptional regulator [Erysipelotrichaceae bacterium 66-17]
MKLDELLEKKGWSAYRLSKETGISQFQISRIRNGSTSMSNVTAKNALAIADALGVSVRELLDDGEDEKC